MRYPPARRWEGIEEIHGRPVADPYRWLETVDSAEARAWRQAQDAVADAYFAARNDQREWWKRQLLELAADELGAPREAGGRLFLRWRSPAAEQGVCLAVEPDGTRRVVVDP